MKRQSATDLSNNELHILDISSDDTDNIEKTIYHLDFPVAGPGISAIYGFKLASEHLKVVLGGQGGDEILEDMPGMGYQDTLNNSQLMEIIKTGLCCNNRINYNQFSLLREYLFWSEGYLTYGSRYFLVDRSSDLKNNWHALNSQF